MAKKDKDRDKEGELDSRYIPPEAELAEDIEAEQPVDPEQELESDNNGEVPFDAAVPAPAGPSVSERAGKLLGNIGQFAGGALSRVDNALLARTTTQAKHQDRVDELSDLFEVPQEDDDDMYVDDLLELDNQDDVLDTDEDGSFDSILGVSREDVMGTPPRQGRKMRRTAKRYEPPEGIGEMRGY